MDSLSKKLFVRSERQGKETGLNLVLAQILLMRFPHYD
jgi:hypothetical protein